MFGPVKLQSLAKQILSLAKTADQAEVLISTSRRALTRFANNQIHQSVASSDASLQIRAVLGKRLGVASTDRLDKQGLEQVVNRALALAKNQREDPGFVSLPRPAQSYPQVNSFSPATAAQTPQQRAKSVATVIKLAQEARLSASGAYDNLIGETVVANTLGIWAYSQHSKASLSTILTGDFGSGYASGLNKASTKINSEKIGRLAVHKATFGGQPQELEPGEYSVILEPTALANLLDFYLIYGPNARIYHEDVSYLQGQLGKRAFSPQVTLIDDPLDIVGLPSGFDFEGVPKTPLFLIDRGVIKGIAYDSYYAQKYRKKNTAHALPAPNTWGPIPTHAKLLPGQASAKELISSTKNGLLVTRLWYIRLLHPRQLSVTGMTRDGLFIIKDGELTGRAKNLRFTDSLPSVFRNITEVGKDLELVGEDSLPCLLPPVKISRFNFTSATQFG